MMQPTGRGKLFQTAPDELRVIRVVFHEQNLQNAAAHRFSN
jgi:hypothetical protein